MYIIMRWYPCFFFFFYDVHQDNAQSVTKVTIEYVQGLMFTETYHWYISMQPVLCVNTDKKKQTIA